MYRKRKRRFMDVREFMREMGRRGGKARAKKLTPEKRLEIAIKASNAAKEARQRKAEANARKDGRGK